MVTTDLSELRAFEFSGSMPGPSIQTAHVPRWITSCTLNFCSEEVADAAEMASLRDFLQVFASTTNLQLKWPASSPVLAMTSSHPARWSCQASKRSATSS
jgi:hypothetical protein